MQPSCRGRVGNQAFQIPANDGKVQVGYYRTDLNVKIDDVVPPKGNTPIPGVDSPLILTTFNELAFLNDSGELDYRFDDVTFENVSEPGSRVLLGLGVICGDAVVMRA